MCGIRAISVNNENAKKKLKKKGHTVHHGNKQIPLLKNKWTAM